MRQLFPLTIPLLSLVSGITSCGNSDLTQQAITPESGEPIALTALSDPVEFIELDPPKPQGICDYLYQTGDHDCDGYHELYTECLSNPITCPAHWDPQEGWIGPGLDPAELPELMPVGETLLTQYYALDQMLLQLTLEKTGVDSFISQLSVVTGPEADLDLYSYHLTGYIQRGPTEVELIPGDLDSNSTLTVFTEEIRSNQSGEETCFELLFDYIPRAEDGETQLEGEVYRASACLQNNEIFHLYQDCQDPDADLKPWKAKVCDRFA